jgi:hypothetical protein
VSGSAETAATGDPARALAPTGAGRRRGLRLTFFSIEEWALAGSARYVAGLSET